MSPDVKARRVSNTTGLARTFPCGRFNRLLTPKKVLATLLFAFCIFNFELMPQPAAQAADLTVWVVPALARVKPSDVPGTSTQMSIYAALGEYQSFQIIVQAPAGGLTNVNLSASDLVGPDGQILSSSNLSLFREYYLTIAAGQTSPDWRGSNRPLGPGTYPDGLIPFVDPDTGDSLTGGDLQAVPCSVAEGQNQPFWVDVFVPRSAAAGTYSGTLTMTSDQGEALVTLTLKVWNFTLPLTPAFQSSMLVWDDAHKRSTDKELMRNRLMPSNVSDGTEASDLINNWGLSLSNIPLYSGTAYGQCTPDRLVPTVSEVQNAARPFRSWGLSVYDYSFDEVDDCTSLFPTIIRWAQSLHQADVPQLITMAPNPALYDDGLGTGRSAVDIWVMQPDTYDHAQSYNPPRVTYVLNKGDQAWSYQGLVEDAYSPKLEIDFSPMNFRIFGLINQSLGLTGFLYWRVDGWLSGTGVASWDNVFYHESGSTYPGEAIWVYPGEAVGMDRKVAPSMRLRWFRDGVQDYEYVELLKGLGQGDWALNQTRTVASDWTNWTRDPDAIENVHQTLAQKIEELSGPPPDHGLH